VVLLGLTATNTNYSIGIYNLRFSLGLFFVWGGGEVVKPSLKPRVAFCDMTPFWPVNCYRHFKEACCLNLQGTSSQSSWITLTLKMEKTIFSAMSVNIYQSTCHCTSEDVNICQLRCQYLTSVLNQSCLHIPHKAIKYVPISRMYSNRLHSYYALHLIWLGDPVC
jgi:hypothetical protein